MFDFLKDVVDWLSLVYQDHSDQAKSITAFVSAVVAVLIVLLNHRLAKKRDSITLTFEKLELVYEVASEMKSNAAHMRDVMFKIKSLDDEVSRLIGVNADLFRGISDDDDVKLYEENTGVLRALREEIKKLHHELASSMLKNNYQKITMLCDLYFKGFKESRANKQRQQDAVELLSEYDVKTLEYLNEECAVVARLSDKLKDYCAKESSKRTV